ncbi:MAG: hypothetical protein IJV64_08640 [Oscillospiraceae bacterium]|nr:hypothetical protein [Oscillospiraceae bacterium]
MKKLIYCILALAALTLAGCNKVSSGAGADGEALDAVFTVSTESPAAATKAYSDGSTADELVVAVYRYEGGTAPANLIYLPAVSKTVPIATSTTVHLSLIRGERYEIVFWAQKSGNGFYTFDPAARKITVNPAGPANDETRDAFYAKYSTGVVSAALNETVSLKRPFAQINVLTTNADWQAALDSQIAFAGSSMSLTAPTVLDLISGGVSEPKAWTLSRAAIVSASPNVGTYAATHKYIAMNYILAAPESVNAAVTFSVYKTGSDAALNTRTVSNVPYRRNYRTNIVGEVFSVDGQFNVVIVPAYATPDNTVTLP